MSLKSLLIRNLIRRSKFTYVTSVAVGGEKNYNDSEKKDWKHYKTGIATALLGSVLIGTNIKDQIDNKEKSPKNKQQKGVKNENNVTVIEAGEKRSDLPTYKAEEVYEHNTKNSFWVTYKHGVYDVTKFLPSHPGGEQIYNAGGLSIEPFWNVYGMHKTQEVYKLLESYRIGNLHDDDVVDHTDDELWVNEPIRDRRLIVKTLRPFNAEIPPMSQIEHFNTPNELFYVRQHMPVPELEASTHKLTVTVVDNGVHTKQFSLEDLGQFERRSITAALMCAGNRRSEMDKVKPVKGISWAGGAISNAVWEGVYLRDVLIHCGVDVENTEGKHVILEGSDVDATGTRFSTSIPLGLAASGAGRVLLATHMNGQPLPADHGRPLRAVVPGAPAVRSVKWLESITVSEEESSSHWHQKDYRSFNPSVTWETADFPSAPPVYSLPVTSSICYPADGDRVKVKDGFIQVKGYAYSGGGSRIIRVDVSCDRGATWHAAGSLTARGDHSWTLWDARLPAPAGTDEVELWAKATDSNFNTQPETFEHIWNIRGILSNAYHRIKVKLEH